MAITLTAILSFLVFMHSTEGPIHPFIRDSHSEIRTRVGVNSIWFNGSQCPFCFCMHYLLIHQTVNCEQEIYPMCFQSSWIYAGMQRISTALSVHLENTHPIITTEIYCIGGWCDSRPTSPHRYTHLLNNHYKLFKSRKRVSDT